MTKEKRDERCLQENREKVWVREKEKERERALEKYKS